MSRQQPTKGELEGRRQDLQATLTQCENAGDSTSRTYRLAQQRLRSVERQLERITAKEERAKETDGLSARELAARVRR